MRILLICGALLLALPLGVAQTSPAEGLDYRLELACPGEGLKCPITAVDGLDAMGDPALAVDPFRPSNLIIASLHGGGDNDAAPGPKSRSGQAFTTFTSSNGGAGWWDNPFTPPAAIRSNGQAYGEHPALTLSPYGQAFVGSLYSVPRATNDASAGFDYVLAAQKFRSLQSINENQGGDGDYNAQFLTALYPGNAIRQMWYVFNPVTDNMSVVWIETVTPQSSAASKSLPRAADSLDEAVDALRRQAEAAVPGPLAGALRQAGFGQFGGAQTSASTGAAGMQTLAGDGPSSVIGLAWTDLNAKSKYRFQPRDEAIGPCATSTNPVIKEGYLYIGCKVADEGPFRWNPEAKPGDIEIFRMDPDGGTPEYLGPAPISGGNPKMGVRSDGRVALMTVDVDRGRLVLDAVYGGLHAETGMILWGKAISYGDQVPEVPDFDVVGANIQDLIYREYSGVIHIILKRNVERTPELGNAPRPFDPSINKAIVALDEKHGYLAYHALDVGNIVNRTQDSTLMRQSDAVFDDISDDFLELPAMPHRHNGRHLGDAYAREFFAVGDYGIVLFAELIEITDLRGPGAVVTIPLPPSAPAPAPAAVSSTALAGALSTAGVTAFAAATLQRKVATGAKKKR